MITFIIQRTAEATVVIPWPDATPSARKAFRKTGQGITVLARDEAQLKTCLPAYF